VKGNGGAHNVEKQESDLKELDLDENLVSGGDEVCSLPEGIISQEFTAVMTSHFDDSHPLYSLKGIDRRFLKFNHKSFDFHTKYTILIGDDLFCFSNYSSGDNFSVTKIVNVTQMAGKVAP